ncbi:MAG: rRNA (guanine527-N7)-methyltransferase [Myxococcales bacterium]|jgi:16S rRNA (guanine527-N7)-methyltransferase|nr:rRNA (guanine527-N7)-methyltransferase [Myxococcales bacterium]
MEGEEQERLRQLAQKWKRPLGPDAESALLQYGKLLLEWSARINLTGAKSLLALIDDHFPDAFALADEIEQNGPSSVVDAGSGGGLPALPTAVLVPDSRFVLVEPIHKKVAFLRTAVRALGLTGRAAVAAGRVEDPAIAARGPFDVAVSRATFQPVDWLSRGLPLVRPGGRVIALTAERSLAPPAGLRLSKSIGYADGNRWLLSFERST